MKQYAQKRNMNIFSCKPVLLILDPFFQSSYQATSQEQRSDFTMAGVQPRPVALQINFIVTLLLLNKAAINETHRKL